MCGKMVRIRASSDWNDAFTCIPRQTIVFDAHGLVFFYYVENPVMLQRTSTAGEMELEGLYLLPNESRVCRSFSLCRGMHLRIRCDGVLAVTPLKPLHSMGSTLELELPSPPAVSQLISGHLPAGMPGPPATMRPVKSMNNLRANTPQPVNNIKASSAREVLVKQARVVDNLILRKSGANNVDEVSGKLW